MRHFHLRGVSMGALNSTPKFIKVRGNEAYLMGGTKEERKMNLV